jgi:AcrR family transcriptional regulator
MATHTSVDIKIQLKTVKKERIMAEAIRLFYEQGYRGTTLEQIADALGVTKPFLYGVYDKKTDILFDISLQSITSSLEAIQEGYDTKGPATQRLVEVVRRLTAVCINHQKAVAVYFREQASLEPKHLKVIHGLRKKFDRVLALLLEEGVRDKVFSVDDSRTASHAISGMVSWTYVWFRNSGRLSQNELMDQMAQYALRIAGAKSK